jgi:hypothetical protein
LDQAQSVTRLTLLDPGGHLRHRNLRSGEGRRCHSGARGSMELAATPLLILFTESLDGGSAVGIEEFLAVSPPRCFKFGRCDIPVRPALPEDRTQVLAEIFQSGPAEQPVAIVDLINEKTGLEDYHVGDHGIVDRIGIFGDVEILSARFAARRRGTASRR